MLICGMALMGYSYFVDGIVYIILIGVGLIVPMRVSFANISLRFRRLWKTPPDSALYLSRRPTAIGPKQPLTR